jgi:iron complex transport system substrate-binding protein
MSEQRTRSEWDTVTSEKIAAGNLWLNLDAVCNQHVYHFDGSALFNRPGPRLIDALEAVTKIVEDWHAAQA